MTKKYALLVMVLFLFGISCSKTYESITGTVVDAETGKPLEGAVVLAEWTKTKGLGLTYTESYKVVEVVTDKEGKFTIPGVMSPLVDPPSVTIYKKGYVAWNNNYIFPGYQKREDFSWRSGYVFKMNHFKKGYSYEAHVSFIRMSINSSINSKSKRTIQKAFDWETDMAQQEMARQGR